MTVHYQNVHALLDYLRSFHERAARLYEALAASGAQERAQLLLEWLAGHERRFAAAIREFEAAPENSPLMAEWLQYIPHIESMVLSLPALPETLSLDDALTLASSLDAHLQKLLTTMLENADKGEVRELFADLLSQAQAEARLTARNAAQLNDL